MKKKITKTQAIKLGKEFRINFDVVPIDEWHAGLNIELEHTDVTDGSFHRTAKIAIAHLKEYPDYYKYLIKLEANRNKYWSTRIKPDIFL